MSRSELREIARGFRWGRPAPRPPWTDDPRVRTNAEFRTAWARTPLAGLVRAVAQEALVLPALRMLASPVVTGRERLERLPEPAILVANHASHLDTAIVIEALPQPWRQRLAVGAAADSFFADRAHGAAAALLMGAFPVERTRASMTSAKLAVRLVTEGWNLLLFPEGGRSDDGWVQPFRPGAGFVAVRTGRPIVPIWIQGTEHLLPKGQNRPRRGQVRVLIGDALWPGRGETPRDLTIRTEHVFGQLSVEASTDWWTSLRQSRPDLGGPDAARWRRVWARGQPPVRRQSDWR